MPHFRDAISGKGRISVIAEIKRYSPSYGKPFPSRKVSNLVRAYTQGGAEALSVVTAEDPFKGSLALLKEARSLTKLPLLRKDFITTVADLDESRKAGADAVLLITNRLTNEQLQFLVEEAIARTLDLVVEAHFDEDFEKIEALMKIFAPTDVIIGINNRNLENFKTDVQYAEKFLHRLNPTQTIIAESAFQNAEDFLLYQGKIDAVLVGTALLTAPDPIMKLSSFTSYKFLTPKT